MVREQFTAISNDCLECAPLGAALALSGVASAITVVRGPERCGARIVRTMTEHFREPVEIFTSDSEDPTAWSNDMQEMEHLRYLLSSNQSALAGIITSCRLDTGIEITLLLRKEEEQSSAENAEPLEPPIRFSAETFSDAFHGTARVLVGALTGGGGRKSQQVNLLPGPVSPVDLRYLKEILTDFGLAYILLPDYAETLDGPLVARQDALLTGGTPLADIRRMGKAGATLEFGRMLFAGETAGKLLRERCHIPWHRLAVPLGLAATDHFFKVLEKISDRPTPKKYRLERGRLLDAYADGHQYISGVRVLLYGEEDLVVGLAGALAEIGILPVLCATGGHNERFAECIRMAVQPLEAEIRVCQGVDLQEIGGEAATLAPDVCFGNSFCVPLSEQLGIPLIRVGFPILDRFGGQRILHLGYRGALQLFDQLVNTLLAHPR